MYKKCVATSEITDDPHQFDWQDVYQNKTFAFATGEIKQDFHIID